MKNMKVLGNSLTITSDLTKDEIVSLQKYAPEALVLTRKNEDENYTEEYFRVSYREGCDNVSQYGVCFPNTNASGNVTVTALIPSELSVEKRKEFILDNFQSIATNLVLVEEQAKTALETVKKNRDEFANKVKFLDEDDTVVTEVKTTKAGK